MPPGLGSAAAALTCALAMVVAAIAAANTSLDPMTFSHGGARPIMPPAAFSCVARRHANRADFRDQPEWGGRSTHSVGSMLANMTRSQHDGRERRRVRTEGQLCLGRR